MFSRKLLDLWIFVPTLLLLIIGIIAIVSIKPENLPSHIMFLSIGILFFTVILFIDKNILYSFSGYLYIFGLFLLLLPLIFGTVTRGAVRWIDIGIFTIQPSEIIKPLVILFSATYWSAVKKFSIKKLLRYLIYVSPSVGLVILQPDLGSALIIVVGIVTSLLFSGITFKQTLITILFICLISPIAWFAMHDYQRNRIMNFVDPYRDPLGTGYNAIQAKIAVGSGIIMGKGIGRGTQSHLAFLPEKHNDFIFASYAEEFGFAGSMVLLLLYFILFIRVILISKRVENSADQIVLHGLLAIIFIQTMVNVGMNIGIMPIAGVTLPLISYGGSSLITTLMCFGLICNVASDLQRKPVIRIT